MRVIGNASATIEKKVICQDCGTKLGYLPIDIETKKHTDYSGSTDVIKFIVCPICAKEIDI